MEHKDIDRLFQEKLKDMEVAPDPKIWNAIEQKLQKKKRRIIPVWWFYGGTAACLIVGLFLLSNVFDKEPIKDNFPVVTEEIIKENNSLKDKEEILVTEEVVEEKNNIGNTESLKTTKKNSIENSNFKSVVTKQQKNSKESIEKDAFFTNEIIDNEINNSSGKNIVKEIVENEKNNNFRKDIEKEVFPSREIVINEKGNNSGEDTVKGVSSSEEIAKKTDLSAKKEIDKKDFIAEISKQKELEKSEKETLKNKWSVSPVVGFLKSDSFSQASALGANFDANDFSGENTVSYGVNFTYKLNEKWALKSGVQIQKTAFKTNDINFLSSMSGSIENSLENVLFNDDTKFFEEPVNDINANFGGQGGLETELNGALLQNYGYIEIPVEVKYTFISFQKIKTSVISGVSSLILNENNITGKTDSFSSKIGSATNLSSLNFSGNLGLDFDLELSEKLNFNINPILKAQLKTFNGNSNGFKPYNIGVYTGIRYKF